MFTDVGLFTDKGYLSNLHPYKKYSVVIKTAESYFLDNLLILIAYFKGNSIAGN
jgi:hypothetical protein